MADTIHQRICECLDLLVTAQLDSAERNGYDAELQGLEAARDGFAIQPERFLGHSDLRRRYEQGHYDGMILLQIERSRNITNKEG